MQKLLDEMTRGLAELRKRDKARKVFGASTHEYRLNAKLTEAQVAESERRWGFRVPEDYRAFLTELGNGGAGPFYGVFRLGEIDDGFGSADWETWKLEPRKEFPHRKAWNDRELLYRSAPDGKDEAAYDEWLDSEKREGDFECYLKGIAVDRGCIPLCHEGCAFRYWLVVTGPEAGSVWHDASADENGISPVRRA